MDEAVYLDHHATTPCDPRVIEAMLPFFSEIYGNPSAITHEHGRRAATALEEARATVASFFNVRPNEVFFTAGATESNNTVLFGSFPEGGHLVTSAVEHKSVLEPAQELERRGIDVTVLPVDPEGFVDPETVREAIREDTKLVSIMWANGEIGTIEPVAEIAAICEERGVPFHSDATQAVGKISVDLDAVPCRFLSLSAHKIYGPKGIGALIARRGRKPKPLIIGGGQEKKLRSGTVNVPGAVGLAEALDLRRREMFEEAERLTEMRDHLWNRIASEIENVTVHGPGSGGRGSSPDSPGAPAPGKALDGATKIRDGEDAVANRAKTHGPHSHDPQMRRLPGNLSVAFHGVEGEELMMAMRNFSLSSGSACSAGAREPSSVLTAIGLDDRAAMSTIRFGLGKENTRDQIDRLVEDLRTSVERLRELSI